MDGTLYIAELLEQHDCVIVPGLGGFIGSYHPAAIHPLYHTFQPPYKKLLFNVSLKHNDGLLADHMARKEQISFAEANEKVRKYAEECSLRLKLNKQILIRDVGRLFLGQEGTIQFDQDLRHNLLAESFGLQPFFSVPVHKEQEAEAPAMTHERVPVTVKLARRAVYRPLRWAAILAIPVGLAILLSITGYDRLKTSGLTYADILSSISVRLSPFSTEEKKAEPVPLRHAAAEVRNNPPASTETRPAAPALQPEPVATPVPDGRFAVIVGAFRVRENATRLITRLQDEGLPASLYDVTPGGLHRVTAGRYSDRAEAIESLHRIRAKGFEGAWLLVK